MKNQVSLKTMYLLIKERKTYYRSSYDRILADLKLDQVNISKIIINSNLVVKYNKNNLCK